MHLSVGLQAVSQSAHEGAAEGLNGCQACRCSVVGQQLHDVVQQQGPQVVEPAQVVQQYLHHARQGKQPALCTGCLEEKLAVSCCITSEV